MKKYIIIIIVLATALAFRDTGGLTIGEKVQFITPEQFLPDTAIFKIVNIGPTTVTFYYEMTEKQSGPNWQGQTVRSGNAVVPKPLVDAMKVNYDGTVTDTAALSAYIFGGRTQGVIENSSAVAGAAKWGAYWQMFGSGLCTGRNLNFSGAGNSTNEAGIYLNEQSILPEPLQLVLENVAINGTAAAGIRNDDATSVQMCNVSFANIGTTNTQGLNFSTFTDCNAPPTPPPPAPNPKPNAVLRPGKPARIKN